VRPILYQTSSLDFVITILRSGFISLLGTQRMVEQVLKERGLNVRKLDQRVEIGSTEAIKSLVVAEIGVAFFSCWEIQNELATGTLREINIPGLRIHRVFSWALPSGDLGGLPGEFYRFANSIRTELSAVSFVAA
jgi:LysR family transcriptional regulator, transcriptional activator of the cysJI operon